MAITKAEIITKLDANIVKLTSELATAMADGDISVATEEIEMMRCVSGIQWCENAKTWVEANL